MNNLTSFTSNAIDGNYKDINTLTLEIKTIYWAAIERNLRDAVKLGRKLTEAKELLEHGQWGDWVKNNLPFSQSKADKMMQIYERFGSKQESLFGDLNSETFTNLGISQAFALLAVPENEMEDFVKENKVEEMSVRELKEAIKERDIAKSAVEKAEAENEKLKAENEELKNASADIEKAVKEREDALERMKSAQEAAEKAAAELKKAEEAKKKAEAELKTAKENPDIPEAMKKEIGAEAAAAAKKEAAERISEAEEKLRKASAELKDAQNQLKMSNPNVAEFGLMFKLFQEDFNRINGMLIKIRNSDPDIGTKLTTAVSTALQQFAKGIEE